MSTKGKMCVILNFYKINSEKYKTICGGESMSYLYHYTSLDTLALILKNRTLCFNNLRNVDDMEEADRKSVV